MKTLLLTFLTLVSCFTFGQDLTTINLNTYNGVRLTPKAEGIAGFHVGDTINKNIGFSVINADAVGNAAQANVFVKGTGPLYTNYTGLSHYNAGYYVSYLQNSGLLFSDSELYLATWNKKKIEFRTGNTFSTMLPTFTIGGDGIITMHNVPTYDGETAASIGGLTTGNVYKTASGDLKIKL